MATLHIFLVVATLPIFNMEYIPPSIKYPCPKETDLLFPCICENGTDVGLFVTCENTGLAAISVGIGNIAGLGLPIEKLVLRDIKVSRLFGPLFHRSTIRILHIEGAPITSIEPYVFAGVNRTLNHLRMEGTRLEEFPKEAFRILGNVTTIHIDGHRIVKLSKDIFAGSEAAGRLERLSLSNGLISDIAPEAFQTLKKLKTLDLHGNRLVTLKKNQFKGLRDAEVLDLSYNNLTKLDGSHIGDLTKLGWCNASHNNLGDIPRGMFARNTVIKVVHLDNNKIKKIDTNSFRGMRFLRRLYLQDNIISEVGRGTFAAVTRIGTVDLARNRITTVDYQMFQQVKYAEIINLAENQITTIESQAFTDLYAAKVNISFNKINKIEPNSFINCNNLTLLDLSYNNLTEISKSAFDVNTYAFELKVTHNNFTSLSQIPINNMTGLAILNASYNAIEVIPKGSIPKLYELHTVDLSHNNLKEIFNGIFQSLFSLRYLDLSHNSLEQLKPSTFGTMSTVLRLDLSFNLLRSVPRGALAKLASCRTMLLGHNQLDKAVQVPPATSEIDLSYNNISALPSNTWPQMNALLRLNLSNNHLEDNLASDSFLNLLALQSLDLSGNRMTRTPWEALNTMSSLQYLYLQDNNLTSLTKSAFGNLPTIFHVDLSNNQIDSISPMSFLGLQQLLHLSLSKNKLENVPNEALKSLVALRKLDLSHNMLERIDNKTNGLLDDCLSIESVDLSHNRFEVITKKTFPSNPYIPYKLYEVDLSFNQIPVLTHDITFGTQRLKKLNVSYNMMNDMQNNVLGNLTSLQILDLSNNELRGLESTFAISKLHFPENITEMYLRNNFLQSLPVDLIYKSKLLKLDVRNNDLKYFEPKLVHKIRENGLTVLFQGNHLICDCQIRPLKHLINHMSQRELSSGIYENITCSREPFENQNVFEVDEERLVCPDVSSDDDSSDDVSSASNKVSSDSEKFDLVSEPDLVLRDLQYAQDSLYINWYVLTTEDVADFYIYLRNHKNKLHYNDDVSYNQRSVTIQIDDELKTALKRGEPIELCIQGKHSTDTARKWYQDQCKSLPSSFDSWPKKLTKNRRVTKKRTYSWFSSSVLGLVGDSILITLCIFLGVCFRRLGDFE